MSIVATSRGYSHTKSCAFWDVEEFPIPQGGDLYSFADNLDTALKDYDVSRDPPIIKAYSARQTREVNDLYRSADISVEYEENDKRKRLCKMLLDIDNWARRQPTNEGGLSVNTHVLVIAKDVPEKDSLFVPLLDTLSDIHYDISLVVPVPGQYLPKKVLSIDPLYLWTWEALFRGEPCIQDEDYYERACDE